jgi:hypothetical protein
VSFLAPAGWGCLALPAGLGWGSGRRLLRESGSFEGKMLESWLELRPEVAQGKWELLRGILGF